MDRTPQIISRAIVATSVIVLAATAGAVLHLWLRGRDHPPPRRERPPLLINEPDGSVYDLNLKLASLEDRLMKEEQRSKEERAARLALRKENERLDRDLRALEAEVARLRRQIPRRPEPEAPPGGASPPATGPGPGPEPPTNP